MVDPENADVDYFYALYYFKVNKIEEGSKSLLQAIKKGFADKLKLLSEPAFSNFLKTKEGQQLLAKME
jgi:hypothetical protein